MRNLWTTADTHYHHKNIVSSTSRFDDKDFCRCFRTLEEHDYAIIDGINANVKENDVLIHVGDWSFGGLEKTFEFRKQIRCKNIHLVLGNHDHHIEKNSSLNGENCRDLFVSVDHIYKRIYAKTKFVFCHYAMKTWENSNKGTIMLYGHSHGRLPEDNQLTMDVGVDVAYSMFNSYRPFHIEEILQIMKNKK